MKDSHFLGSIQAAKLDLRVLKISMENHTFISLSIQDNVT